MFQGFLSLYLWANNQWGWTRPPLIKVSLYSLSKNIAVQKYIIIE